MTFLQIFENRIPFPSPLNLFTRLNLPSLSPVFCIVIHRKGTDCPFLKLFCLLCILLPVALSSPEYYRYGLSRFQIQAEWSLSSLGRHATSSGSGQGLPAFLLIACLPGPMDPLACSAVPSSQRTCTLLSLLRAGLVHFAKTCHSRPKSRLSILLKPLIPSFMASLLLYLLLFFVSTTHLCSCLLMHLSP